MDSNLSGEIAKGKVTSPLPQPSTTSKSTDMFKKYVQPSLPTPRRVLVEGGVELTLLYLPDSTPRRISLLKSPSRRPFNEESDQRSSSRCLFWPKEREARRGVCWTLCGPRRKV